jgi:hypothetical protein
MCSMTTPGQQLMNRVKTQLSRHWSLTSLSRQLPEARLPE